MIHLAARLLEPIRAIFVAEGIPDDRLWLAHSEGLGIGLDALAGAAARLESALGGPHALLDAATSVRVWPQPSARVWQAACPYELCRTVWEDLLPSGVSSLVPTWDDRGPDHFVVSATLGPPLDLRSGLGMVIAGALRTAPLFYGLGPAHVEVDWVGWRMRLVVAVPPYENFARVTPSSRIGRKDTLDEVIGLLEDRAACEARRASTTAAACALGQGLATARTSDDAAKVAVRVLTTHLGFRHATMWAESATHQRRLLASVGERVGTTNVLSIPSAAGAIGVLEVDRSGDESFLEALLPCIGADLAQRLAREEGHRTASLPANRWNLTPHQLQVAVLLGEGRANKEIAVALGCTVATVEEHLTSVYRKVGVTGRGPLLSVLARQSHS